MSIVRFSVLRPITIVMLYVLIFLLGIMSWFRMPREFMPNLEFPQLMVLTTYENASSQEVENLVTKVVEEACGTVKGVKRIHSISKEGVSIVTVEFVWGVNMDFASLNLREKIDLVKSKLPREANEPQIEKFNPFALPVITLSLSGNRPSHELLRIAKKPVVELLEKVPKVATVSVVGGLEREIRIELDQSKLTSYKVPLLKVIDSVDRNNITYPAGSVEDETFEYVIRIMGAFKTLADIGDLVVSVDKNIKFPSNPSSITSYESENSKQNSTKSKIVQSPVTTLASLGTVIDSFKERTSYSRYDRKENISLGVYKQGDANIVKVAEQVKKKLTDIKDKVPEGINLNVVYDESSFIQKGIKDMVKEGLMGAVLCFFVLFLFLGNYKEALVVNVVIPMSMLITLFLMYISGITLNTISLSGLVIGIGFLTDGAIVIIENITRCTTHYDSFKEAVINGTEEVAMAVIGSMSTMSVVFLPLIFVVGIIGQVFKDLCLTVVYTQLASLIVYFTLLPLLTNFTHSDQKKSNNIIVVKFNLLWEKWMIIYGKILTWAFEKPLRAMLYTGIAFIMSLSIIIFVLPREVFPKVDSDQFIVSLKMPVKTKIEVTNKIVESIEKVLNKNKEVIHIATAIGSSQKDGISSMNMNEAKLVVSLEEKRKETCDEIIQILKRKIEKLDLLGGIASFSTETSGGFGAVSSGGAPILVEIKGYDFNDLSNISNELCKKLKKIKGVFNVNSSLSLSSQEIGVDIKRESLSYFGLSINDVANTMLPAVKGKVVSKFREEGKEFDIRVILREQDRNDLGSIGRLLVHSPLNIDVPIDSFALLTRQLGPNEILHYDQQRTVIVSASLFNRSLNSVKPEIENTLNFFKKQNSDISLELTGALAEMEESFSSMKIVLLISIMLVYMIMAAQFESFWQPFLIMLTIPLSIIGMGPSLLLTGNSLSVMAGIGVVLLCGIVVSNGIVLIEFVNSERKEGKNLKDALINSCYIRMRPIMMTAFTSILSLAPVAIGFSKESQMQSPMAIVIVSGFLVSTFLTLVMLPVFYWYVEENFMKKKDFVN
jgi:hydrophobic/amphiphilic exporter-1 (mainly G- bacteria), HAE1 family